MENNTTNDSVDIPLESVINRLPTITEENKTVYFTYSLLQSQKLELAKLKKSEVKDRNEVLNLEHSIPLNKRYLAKKFEENDPTFLAITRELSQFDKSENGLVNKMLHKALVNDAVNTITDRFVSDKLKS